MKLLVALLASFLILAVVGAGGALYVLHRYGSDLPDYRQLADYQPPTVTRIHAADGRLMAEYAQEKRIFVPIEAIPKRLIQAFLAAEDKNFYRHPGIDPLGVLRAVLTNLRHLADDRRPVGASTITQQVAKNFLLSSEVSLTRKLKEAILAFRIEQAFTKDQILELYLNEIYLGVGSYGVAAAALNYFDKSLDELTIAEAAFLAGLPKAPSWYHPVRQPEAAKARRDWVVGRMLDLGFISAGDADARGGRAAGDAAPRADRDRDRGLLHRGGAARARRGPWRGVPLPGRPVDPHHDGAGAAGAGRQGAARRAARLRSPPRLARPRGPPADPRELAGSAGRARPRRRHRALAARGGPRGRARRRADRP